MLPENKRVNGMWIGERLSPIQLLCIRSFQDAGHEFHLYAWNHLEDLPPNTIMHDIEEVVPRMDRAKFTCNSHFSDWFRVNLIHQLGGWYTDMDEVCLRPFDFEDPYVFVSEFPDHLVNGCIFKAPAGCGPLKWAIDRIAAMDTLHLRSWISVGPQVFRDMVLTFRLRPYVKPPGVFDGLLPSQLPFFVSTESASWEWPAEHQHAVHLRSSYWDEADIRLCAHAVYNSTSAFERLKAKHGV